MAADGQKVFQFAPGAVKRADDWTDARPTMVVSDEVNAFFIRRAIAVAESAAAKTNHPFGAVIVRHTPEGSTVLLDVENEVHTLRDVTAHAELSAVRKISQDQLLSGQTELWLYTSTEPCCMCAGGIYWQGSIGTVVYACSHEKLAEITGRSKDAITRSIGMDVPCRDMFAKSLSRRAAGRDAVEVIGPIFEEEAAKAHEAYW